MTVASNGGEAVELAKQGSYDVILMDLQMPEMDGYEATALIRKNEAGRRTPIIAVSAGSAKHKRDGCLAAGMDDFISKPVDPHELRNVVRKWAIPSSGAVTMGSRNPE